jgi:apolipoprotein D and lipocalin family protein
MIRIALSLALALAAAGPALARQAPEPARKVDAERLYSGRWLEVGRRPMFITKGCVAGATDYTRRADGKVDVRDTCRQGGPDGKERAISGVGTIRDPGTDAKLSVRYNAFVTWDYWILDHDPDYSWFISADPKFKNIFLYTRKAPTPAELKDLTRRAQALGYDPASIEYPPTAP